MSFCSSASTRLTVPTDRSSAVKQGVPGWSTRYEIGAPCSAIADDAPDAGAVLVAGLVEPHDRLQLGRGVAQALPDLRDAHAVVALPGLVDVDRGTHALLGLRIGRRGDGLEALVDVVALRVQVLLDARFGACAVAGCRHRLAHEGPDVLEHLVRSFVG